MQTHEEDAKVWREQKLESLQDGYLNYYDTVRLIITDYENVSAIQSILTDVVYFYCKCLININSHIILRFILIYV